MYVHCTGCTKEILPEIQIMLTTLESEIDVAHGINVAPWIVFQKQ